MPIGTATRRTTATGRDGRGYVAGGGSAHATVPREDRGTGAGPAGKHPPGWSDAAREMVTEIDRAQARFEAGDAVGFTTRAGLRKTGTIEKLNPKRARVRCGDGMWNVPYRLLVQLDETRGADSEERLIEVAAQARELMDEHGLREWTFRFSAARGRLGECREGEKLIRLSRRHAVNDGPEEVKDTILHEIAHALAGAKARHGPVWKAVAVRLGATPKARAEESEEARAGRQFARAGFRAGMEVSFRTKGGRFRTGLIVRMNPKRARVECGDGTVFLVPYPALDPSPGSTSSPGSKGRS